MKRVLKTFLLSILIVMTLGTTTQATKYVDKYNYKSVATKQNTWVKPKGYESNYSYNENTDVYTTTYTDYRYKVNVPANYYMALTLKCKDGGRINFFRALKAKYDARYCSYGVDGVETFYIALPKGTYYIGRDWGDNLAFKYKLYKYVNKPNYISSKALNWNAGKKIAIVQLPGQNYSRWYKLKLTKKKRIYIWGANDIDLFDAKRQPLRVASNNNSDGYAYSSYDKLKAGVYYIRVLGARPSYYNSWHGSVEIVLWK